MGIKRKTQRTDETTRKQTGRMTDINPSTLIIKLKGLNMTETRQSLSDCLQTLKKEIYPSRKMLLYIY